MSATSRRQWPRPRATTHVEVAVGESVPTAEVTDLEHFLTARFDLISNRRSGLAHGAVDHPPWPLRRARVVRLDDDLVTAAGLPRPSGAPLAHHTEGVPVRVGRLRPLDPGAPT